jgi:uncharacterized protein (AIM24 family)
MTQWYLSFDGNQAGPMDLSTAIAQARQNPNGFAWRDGFAEWQPIASIAELNPVPGAPVPAPPPAVARGTGADEIDFKIFGAEMQFVEVELDPGESAVAEAGAMMYKDSLIEMQTVFGDGSAPSGGGGGGFMDKLMGAGKRLLTGESLFMTVFTHTGQGKAQVAFGAPYPGNIIPVPLSSVGGSLICQKDSFLCAAKGVSIGIHMQKKILTGLFGGEGFIMQKLEGDGMVFRPCRRNRGGTTAQSR